MDELARGGRLRQRLDGRIRHVLLDEFQDNGMVSYSVTQRTHEIGLRMALGVRRSDVLRSVIGQGLVLTSIGLGIGLILAFAMSQVLSSLLYEVSATDALTYVGVSVLLVAIALAAGFVPAFRATRIDPVMALRYE